ncbi:DUF4114 domain-containing protein [Sulfidibacter corallicola]|uniref:DUF4114 domain-containing protein n=1 Tax=Sulfidibacter corallicola TaxID=2818388 RepID=A0A8A4TRA5_SULCO|nr:DUF4114 domain-containing protein [Sulfidibacter corallicola]QTD52080.1 DUF4114 domain-containing protein [Sulfidibacter corallicola]
MLVMLFCFFSLALMAQVGDDSCTEQTKEYNNGSQFDEDDFLQADGGIIVDNEIHLPLDLTLDTENLLLGIDQPFYVDYLSEGAGANHLFGFFFLDIDTDKDGIPDFFEVGPNDDLDGDGIPNVDDSDDDNDGIPDSSDREPTGVTSMPYTFFRNGEEAYTGGDHSDDYWQFVPNSTISGGDYNGRFEHPGAYIYVDNTRRGGGGPNGVPDVLEYNNNQLPPFVVDRDYDATHVSEGTWLGFLGSFSYEGTPGTTVDDKFHWIGSTIFYIADDDGGGGTTGQYQTYSPYYPAVNDVLSSTNAQPDYYLYGVNSGTHPNVPEILKNDDGTPKTTGAPRNEQYWQFRWYQSNVSGAREMVFFLVVFYPSGPSQVNTYYSKSAFNNDDFNVFNTAPNSPGTNGDAFGGAASLNDWYPRFQHTSDHNLLARRVFGSGTDWGDIATSPTDGSAPVAHNSANQEWVDMWANWQNSRRILQYRSLRDWFSGTSVDANNVINGRYGLDMSQENDSSLIRAINGKMAHLMVGAPQSSRDAWLLGWEDLHGTDGGNDRDYEDVVFYVKREAGGQLQSLNVAQEARDQFEDFSLTQVSFTFEDNFTDGNWNIEGRYVNYFYRLASNDEWIPLLGGKHERTPDVFHPNIGSTTVENGRVTRTVTIQVQDRKQELYWKVEMATDSVDLFQPRVYDAEVSYQTLVHDFFYNAPIIPSAEIRYIPSVETPEFAWEERHRNRGHLYAHKAFDHGQTLTPTVLNQNPEDTPTAQPPQPIQWDAGVSMKADLDSGTTRNIYTYIPSDATAEYSNNLARHDFSRTTVDADIVSAFNLTGEQSNGVWLYNFHDPSAPAQDRDSAALWLQNWIHGYSNPVVSSGNVDSTGPEREWILGGINRPAVDVIRAPGVPPWIFGSGLPSSIKRSYIDFMESQENLSTRVLIGTEWGLLHCIDAGTWVGNRKNPTDQYADGHFRSDNFGTGQEVWAMLPGHLLDDMKHNYAGTSQILGKIDATVHSFIVYDETNTTWRRVAYVVQGYQAGNEEYSGGESRTGNVVLALDLTDPDNPQPMWHRRDLETQDIVTLPSIGWIETGANSRRWVIVYGSGATPVPNQAPSYLVLDAITGEKIDSLSATIGTANSNSVMVGSPALLDVDGNGLHDHLVGATSEGILFVKDLKNGGPVSTRSVTNARFFHTPNVRVANETLQMFVISSDSPFVYDEDEYVNSNFVNSIYGFEFDPSDNSWNGLGSYDLAPRHKVFSRPVLVGSQLVVGTATGDTYSICDYDRNDPGNLLLVDVSRLGAGDELQDSLATSAPVVGAIIVRGSQVEVHMNNMSTEAGNGGVPLSDQASSPWSSQPSGTEPIQMSAATVFGILGWEDTLFNRITIGN